MVRALVVLAAFAPALQAQQLEMVHIDVSQGDATLIRAPIGTIVIHDLHGTVLSNRRVLNVHSTGATRDV